MPPKRKATTAATDKSPPASPAKAAKSPAGKLSRKWPELPEGTTTDAPMGAEAEAEVRPEPEPEVKKAPKKKPAVRKSKKDDEQAEEGEGGEQNVKVKAAPKKTAPAKKAKKGDEADAAGDEKTPKPKKPAKPAAEKVVLVPTPCPPRGDPPGAKFTAISWNIISIRTLLKPENVALLTEMVAKYEPSVLCLQEHKLQEKDVPPIEKQLAELLPSYTAHWTCSTEKKGYSGLVVLTRGSKPSKQQTLDGFLKAKPAAAEADGGAAAGEGGETPVKVTTGLGAGKHDKEGRLITLEYASFYLVFAYVPNSGEGLKRIEYRLEEWDKDLRAYLKSLEASKPVVLGGDLNVAHLDLDIWNPDAKHLVKSAGTTPQERASFGELLGAGFVDTFRHFHPQAENCFTFWSVRAGNRPWNRGLRLDYFVSSSSMVAGGARPALHDAWVMHDAVKSYGDHCPVAVVLSL